MLIFAEAFALAMVACLSTNLDNLLLVLSGGSAKRARTDATVFLAVMGSAVGLALLLSLGVDRFAVPSFFAWIGLVPLTLGIYELQPRRQQQDGPDHRALLPGALALALAANSLDTLLVQTVVFADYAEGYDFAALLGAGAAAVGLAASAHVLLSRHGPSSRLLAFAARARPWILIGVGIMILMDTGFDTT